MRPNIVIIQADQMAAQALGVYGNEIAQTPTIDALANNGAVFDRAYCNSPLCAPSRASMMTGTMPSVLGCYDNAADFPASIPTFAHHLRAVGYHTALVGRMHFIGPDQHHGFEERLTTDVYPADLDMVPDWERPLDQRLQWYHDAEPVFTAGPSHATVQQDFDDDVTFHTLRYLDDRVRANQATGHDVPFLMVTSFMHPHDPYEPPPEHWDRFAKVTIPDPQTAHPSAPDQDPHTHRLRMMSGFDQRPADAATIRRARRAYYAAVSYIDDQVAHITQRLHELRLTDNTVILITSDHGDMLGEKGLWFKMSPYEESIRVPLIISGPDRLIPRGRFASPVSLLDLLPTLIELADAPGADTAGTSLLEVLRREQWQEAPYERDVWIEYLAEGTHAPQITLLRGQYKFVMCPGDPDQLFDLTIDPEELHNVAHGEGYRSIVHNLRVELFKQYDFEVLEHHVMTSQQRRRLVAHALQQGRRRPWDFVPQDRQRYVRGDFWSAVHYGQIRLPNDD